MKFSDGNRDVYLKLPVKVTSDGIDFWIKKATKTSGIFMNNIPPKIDEKKDVVLSNTNNIRE